MININQELMPETTDQTALLRWITAGLSIPEVKSLHGDALYLLGNMVAKFTLAAPQYCISLEALNYLEALKINLEATYPRSKFYGRNSPFIYEHCIPANVVRAQILQAKPEEQIIRKILMQAGSVTVLLRSEDQKLTASGLRHSMPKSWCWGDDPFARYKAVGILISEKFLKLTGKIMR